MIENLQQFLNEEQDPKSVEKVYEKVNGLLTNGEVIEYIAIQKKPAVNISPECIALTSRRIIICRPRNLGFSMDFQDFLWKDVEDCHMKEGFLGAEFTIKTIQGLEVKVDYLPKAQARKLYQIAQEKEEIHTDIRRNRFLEEQRAAAGGVTVTTGTPTHQPNPPAQEDPMVSLQKLKTLFDNQLISQEDYDAKKKEILARL